MGEKIIRVVLTSPVNEAVIESIRAVSSRIRVDQVSPLIVKEIKGDFTRRDRLNFLLERAEVIFGWIHHFPENLLGRSSRLKWIQVMTAGIDRLPDNIKKSNIRITNASGLHGAAISELVLEMMLMFMKEALTCMQMKQQRIWRRFRPKILGEHTVGVVGLGVVGTEIARLCKAFGMKVLGTRRSGISGPAVPYVDRIYPKEQLRVMLSESDFVALALPLTKETRGMIGEQELRAMKPTAYLINVARGAIVDEKALIRALEEKWIAGAGLDVFAQEPLAPESPFFTLPNVILSPHIAGDLPDYESRAAEIFCENLDRYLADEPFLHEVDWNKEY